MVAYLACAITLTCYTGEGQCFVQIHTNQYISTYYQLKILKYHLTSTSKLNYDMDCISTYKSNEFVGLVFQFFSVQSKLRW